MEVKSETQKSKYYNQGIEVEAQILEKVCGFIYNVDIISFSQKILSNQNLVNIHTIKCGNYEQPAIVLLHGYGGSSMGFYKIIKKLSKTYKVYAFDWPGMGLSDRWNFQLQQNNPTQVIEFFVGILEKWRIACGLENFTIVAHSFGGYIASHYYFQYPERINQLFLLSPMGGTKKQQNDQNVEQTQEIENKAQEEEQEEQESGVLNFIANYLSNSARENRYTPQSVLDKWYIPKNYILKTVVNKSLKNESDENKILFVKYFQSIFNLPGCDDSYIHDLVDYPSLDPQISLEELFSSNEYINRPDHTKKDFYVLYGDNDFMDSQGCENLFSQNILSGYILYLHDSSHGVMIDAPNQVLAIINKPKKCYVYPYVDPIIFQKYDGENQEEILLNEQNLVEIFLNEQVVDEPSIDEQKILNKIR
ncbi:hypothetical protein ABPG74_000183 [Tetrahymena malaccensis]